MSAFRVNVVVQDDPYATIRACHIFFSLDYTIRLDSAERFVVAFNHLDVAHTFAKSHRVCRGGHVIHLFRVFRPLLLTVVVIPSGAWSVCIVEPFMFSIRHVATGLGATARFGCDTANKWL